MKHWLALAALICFGSTVAHAQATTYQAPPSTATSSGLFVSSQTVTRVDNLNNGTTGQILANRTAIVLSVPASGKMNCDFDIAVSTIPPSLTVAGANYGMEYTAGVYIIPLPTNLAYYCLSASASAGQSISVQQVSPFKPGSRRIPGNP